MSCMLKVIHYYLQMYMNILEISVLKYMNLILHIFLSLPGLAWLACLKKNNVWAMFQKLPVNGFKKMCLNLTKVL